jgi:1,4-dihydroxy-2-naphthoate polyprenyltransferase
MFSHPKPEERPAEYPAEAWPLWFVAMAFQHNRRFGLWYLFGLIVEAALHGFGIL